jgi:hypothetical protein
MRVRPTEIPDARRGHEAGVPRRLCNLVLTYCCIDHFMPRGSTVTTTKIMSPSAIPNGIPVIRLDESDEETPNGIVSNPYDHNPLC